MRNSLRFKDRIVKPKITGARLRCEFSGKTIGPKPGRFELGGRSVFASWTCSAKISFMAEDPQRRSWGVIWTAIGAIAAILCFFTALAVVPEFRRAIGWDKSTSSVSEVAKPETKPQDNSTDALVTRQSPKQWAEKPPNTDKKPPIEAPKARPEPRSSMTSANSPLVMREPEVEPAKPVLEMPSAPAEPSSPVSQPQTAMPTSAKRGASARTTPGNLSQNSTSPWSNVGIAIGADLEDYGGWLTCTDKGVTCLGEENVDGRTVDLIRHSGSDWARMGVLVGIFGTTASIWNVHVIVTTSSQEVGLNYANQRDGLFHNSVEFTETSMEPTTQGHKPEALMLDITFKSKVGSFPLTVKVWGDHLPVHIISTQLRLRH